jgi:hypothetical protein
VHTLTLSDSAKPVLDQHVAVGIHEPFLSTRFLDAAQRFTFTRGRASKEGAPQDNKGSWRLCSPWKLVARHPRRQLPDRRGAGLGTGPPGAPGGCNVLLYRAGAPPRSEAPTVARLPPRTVA